MSFGHSWKWIPWYTQGPSSTCSIAEKRSWIFENEETVVDYYYRINRVMCHIRALGKDLPKSRVVEKILISLTAKLDATFTTLKQTKDSKTTVVSRLMGSLEAYEKWNERRKEKSFPNSTFKTKLSLHHSPIKGSQQYDKDKSKFPPCKICKNKKKY